MVQVTPALHSAVKERARRPITTAPDIHSWRAGLLRNETPANETPTGEPDAAAKSQTSKRDAEAAAKREDAAPKKNDGNYSDYYKRARRAHEYIPEGMADRVRSSTRRSLTDEVGSHIDSKAANGSLDVCKKRIDQPPSRRSINCPDECPYIRPDTVNFCSFACVAKEDCDNRDPLASFADPKTMMCTLCEVPGCDTCGDTRDTCARCSPGMWLSPRGYCLSEYRTYWHACYVAVGAIVLLAVAYIIILWRRPVVNDGVLEEAEEYRRDSQLKYEDVQTQTYRHYPILTNLAFKNVSGVAVLLHFNWQKYIIIWAAIMAFSLSVLAICLQHVPGLMAMMRSDVHPNDPDVFSECVEHGKQDAEEATRADKIFFYFVVAVYVISTLGCLALMIHHRWLLYDDDTSSDTMMDYAVLVEGLPIRSGEADLEAEYAIFLKKAFPDLDIVGVSICWDHSSLDVELDRLVSLLLAAEDVHREREQQEMDPALSGSLSASIQPNMRRLSSLLHTPVQGLGSPTLKELVKAPLSPRRGLCDPKMRCADVVLLGRPDIDTAGLLHSADIQDALKKIQSTSSAYVVFGTQADREKALKASERSPIFFEDNRIQLSKTEYEPETVVWENQGQLLRSKLIKFVGSILALILAIFLWAQCFYQPYADYVLSWSEVSGMRQGGFFQGTLLGLVITLGNQIMYALCDILAGRIRFEYRGSRDAAYVSMYTFAIFINTVLDLWLVLVLAYGYKRDAAYAIASSGAGKSGLAAKAIAHNPSMQDALYVQMVAYLYPGTLLVPYLIEPLFMWLTPYYLYKWLIRSRKSISLFDAQNYLLAFPFDLARYGDIVTCVSVCVLVFFVASSQMWIVFVYLLSMLVFVYIWDHCRLLRISPRSFSSSSYLDCVGMLLLGLPTALLAACVVFRLYGTNVTDLSGSNVLNHMIGAFALHMVLYCSAYFIIARLMPKTALGDCTARVQGKPYADMCRGVACNWFNANHIHCLRTKYTREIEGVNDEKWCVPFKIGREDLLMRAPALGCYFVAGKDADDGTAGDLAALETRVGVRVPGYARNAMIRTLTS